MKRLVKGLAAVTLATLICASVWADGDGRSQHVGGAASPGGYKQQTANDKYRTGLDGGETFTSLTAVDATATSAAAIRSITTAGFQTLTVSASTSFDGAQVQVKVVGYMENGARLDGDEAGTSNLVAMVAHVGTLTGGMTETDADGKYLGSPTAFDTLGYPLFKVFAKDPTSGGNVDLVVAVH